MNPEDLATDWIVDRLETDTTLMNMVSDIAPNAYWATLGSPFVRVDYLDGDDLMVIGLHRVWANCTFHVRGVEHWRGSGRPDRTEINAIGARIDTLLHDHSNHAALDGELEVHSFREEPTPSPSLVESDGTLWLQSGGIYRVRARALVA